MESCATILSCRSSNVRIKAWFKSAVIASFAPKYPCRPANSDESISPASDNVFPTFRFDAVLEQDERLPVTDTVPEPETLAAKFIQQCLDNGSEKVDLSDLGLHSLSNTTLRPLHQLIRSSHDDRTLPPSEDEFSPLTPSLQLFLSRNSLSSLPSELFGLTNTTVLSLRNNVLESIPATIQKLTNLTELNIAGNSLTSLPWELLDLMSPADGRQITVRPNPLVAPTDLSGPSPLSRTDAAGIRSEEFGRCADTRATYQHLRKLHLEQGTLNGRGELELRLKLGRMLRTQALQEASRAGKEVKVGRHELIHLASSRIRYLDVNGVLYRRDMGSDLTQPPCWASCVDTDQAPPDRAAASPSLFELALRSLQQNFDLRGELPEGLSSSVAEPWRQAAANVEQGHNSVCSTCRREYIVPRAEWMEYWFQGFGSQDSLSTEAVLPFLRRACSWACATPSEAGEFRL